jgi:hypothetical protein
MLIAMFIFGEGFSSNISPKGGVVISIICIGASLFGFSVANLDGVRNRLLEPTRMHNYRKQYFNLLGFIGLGMAFFMFFFSSIGNA